MTAKQLLSESTRFVRGLHAPIETCIPGEHWLVRELTRRACTSQTTLAAVGRRQLTVSVVPQYGEAIMDAESDGFPGLIASEISADAEASALTEQFTLTVRHVGLSALVASDRAKSSWVC